MYFISYTLEVFRTLEHLLIVELIEGKGELRPPPRIHLIHYSQKESRGYAVAGGGNGGVLPEQVSPHSCWSVVAQVEKGIWHFAN